MKGEQIKLIGRQRLIHQRNRQQPLFIPPSTGLLLCFDLVIATSSVVGNIQSTPPVSDPFRIVRSTLTPAKGEDQGDALTSFLSPRQRCTQAYNLIDILLPVSFSRFVTLVIGKWPSWPSADRSETLYLVITMVRSKFKDEHPFGMLPIH